MQCPECSRQLPDGSNFCDRCGRPMEGLFSETEESLIQNAAAPEVTEITQTTEKPRWEKPAGTRQYLGMLFLFLIPIAGLTMMIIWSFSKKTSEFRRSLSRAALIVSFTAAAAAVTYALIWVLSNWEGIISGQIYSFFGIRFHF